MKLTRYELSFFDEPQNVGFIQGLKAKNSQKLIANFENFLIVPNYEEILKKINREIEYPASFFTERGIEKFILDIKKIIKFINKRKDGYSVITKEIILNKNDIVLYQDEYQVIIPIDYKK
jgi:hypothetical protein